MVIHLHAKRPSPPSSVWPPILLGVSFFAAGAGGGPKGPSETTQMELPFLHLPMISQ